MRGLRGWMALTAPLAALAVLSLVYVPARAQQNVANLPVTVNGIAGTVSLPTGASIASKQPALGTAGTASTDVITVQGIAAGTPLFVGGAIAHDGADSGGPVKVGFKATNNLSGKTMVANDDRTDGFAGLDGVQVVRPHSNLEDRVSAVVPVTDGSSTSLIAAQGSGVRFCATTVIVSNSSATNVTVDLRDGTSGTVIATIPAAANMGGAVIPLQTPLCTTANTALAMDPSQPANAVTVTAIGFKTKL